MIDHNVPNSHKRIHISYINIWLSIAWSNQSRIAENTSQNTQIHTEIFIWLVWFFNRVFSYVVHVVVCMSFKSAQEYWSWFDCIGSSGNRIFVNITAQTIMTTIYLWSWRWHMYYIVIVLKCKHAPSLVHICKLLEYCCGHCAIRKWMTIDNTEPFRCICFFYRLFRATISNRNRLVEMETTFDFNGLLVALTIDKKSTVVQSIFNMTILRCSRVFDSDTCVFDILSDNNPSFVYLWQ